MAGFRIIAALVIAVTPCGVNADTGTNSLGSSTLQARVFEPAHWELARTPSNPPIGVAPSPVSPPVQTARPLPRATNMIVAYDDRYDEPMVRLACAFKMHSFSGTSEYDRAVNACVAKELTGFSASRRTKQNQDQNRLRKEYGLPPNGGN